jgi:nucleoside-diphosphate-sugar epimerase
MAKQTCVTYARMFNRLYNLPTVVCRLFMVFGPEQKPRKILPYIIRSMIAGEAPQLASAARLVDWIYIDDAVEALLRIGVMANVEGCIVEVGRGEVLSIGEMAARVQRLIPGAPAPVCGGTSAYGRHRRADLREAERLLGWKPVVSLDDGLMQSIKWYRDHMSP